MTVQRSHCLASVEIPDLQRPVRGSRNRPSPIWRYCHIKDVSADLAAAARGEETGIGSSIVSVGGGVNARNIERCITFLQKSKWDGVVSIECHGSDENTEQSLKFMRKLVKARGGKKKARR